MTKAELQAALETERQLSYELLNQNLELEAENLRLAASLEEARRDDQPLCPKQRWAKRLAQ